MIIDRSITSYIVFSEDSIINGLKKITENKSGIIFSVSEVGVMEGVLTDGDFRRWMVATQDINLEAPIHTITNKNYRWESIDAPPEKINSLFTQGISFVPLLDSSNHLVAIARKGVPKIEIGQFTIDEDSPVFVIAEIGNNHNGRVELGKRLIDAVIKSGANCAKFQMRDLKSLYHNDGNSDDVAEDLGSQYTLDLLSRFSLPSEDMFELFDYCKLRGILPLCTPWDLESLRLLEHYGMEAYKLASADLTNHDLLQALIMTGKPLICSTGMSNEQEIHEAVDILKRSGSQYVLLHCNSTYPAPFKDVNLGYLKRLRQIGNAPVGYSGHERGINVAIAAVAMGAKVIEKHLTLDKSLEGNDHKVSLLPDEFTAMVTGIREVEQALGNGEARHLTQGEMMNRETLAKSLVINCELNPGQIITEDMIEVKSPGRGIQPNRKSELIGRSAKRKLYPGDFFFPSDLTLDAVRARNYSIDRAWGIPVRYHDFKSILALTNPKLLEFHLSYKDMNENIYSYFHERHDIDLVVHCPELFEGDHLLDLCSLDEGYRQHSIRELQRVIDITREIKPFFKNSERTLIVTNMGGFTKDAPLKPEQRQRYYDLMVESLSELDMQGVEIIPQTMPPFPWHFGGQRYQNLFMDPYEIADFCERHHMRVCLDVSHSKLACNHHKWSFKEFIRTVGPYTAHLHIVDAKGVDGEGLQIGEGEIDFVALADHLNSYAPDASFIPEIWQGHKNNGEGFWLALDKLENHL